MELELAELREKMARQGANTIVNRNNQQSSSNDGNTDLTPPRPAALVETSTKKRVRDHVSVTKDTQFKRNVRQDMTASWEKPIYCDSHPKSTKMPSTTEDESRRNAVPNNSNNNK